MLLYAYSWNSDSEKYGIYQEALWNLNYIILKELHISRAKGYGSYPKIQF